MECKFQFICERKRRQQLEIEEYREAHQERIQTDIDLQGNANNEVLFLET